MFCTPPFKRAAAPVLLLSLLLGWTTAEASDAPHKAPHKTTKTTASHANESVNRIGMTMIDIPAGNFVMGSCQQASCLVGKVDADASSDETPQHQVSIPKFQMSKTEVTLGQFKKYVEATGKTALLNEDFLQNNLFGDNAPVVQVSWDEAQDFIEWLNKTDGGGYRLPSEAEWEYACRAGGNASYCGGGTLDAVGWHDGNAGERQHPVGEKQANGFGLFDMTGNVEEWVEDCWHGTYSGAPDDGSAWKTSCESGSRVLRGGSWSSNAQGVRAANRNGSGTTNRIIDSGFRVARTR